MKADTARKQPKGTQLLTPQYKGRLPRGCGIGRAYNAPCQEGRRRLKLFIDYNADYGDGAWVRDVSGVYFAIENGVDCGAGCRCDAIATLLPPCKLCGACLWQGVDDPNLWYDDGGGTCCEGEDDEPLVLHVPRLP